jgi:hypothetical protein
MSMRNERPVLSERSESNGPDPIDALIDGAARQMVTGEPSSLLRTAVRDRVAGRRSGSSLVPAWGVAVGVVIAALIVGRVLLSLPDERDTVGPTMELAAPRTPNGPAIEREVVPEQEVVVQQVAELPPVRLTRRLGDDVATAPQEEEPLIPPIAIEPLQPVQIAVGNPITIESSGVMPIEIEPLQIEPLQRE